MKKILKIIISLLLLLSFVPASAQTTNFTLSQNKDFRGLWVATVVNIDYPSKPSADSEILKAEALEILDYAKNTGFNAVFLQVRPASDAIYNSKLFPWSKYLTGQQGIAPNNGFDPLAFWIDEAHKRNIELHAWINPYRVTKKAAKEPAHDFASLAPNNPAVLNPSWVIKHTDGSLYFDPGLPEVRKLIVDGVLEIINNYSVDGIHFDDYFYPGKNFDDKISSTMYKPFDTGIDDWRRENVNTLIKDVSTAIKSTGRNIRFGISPFGIWANKASHPLGSDTNGAESYFSHYADSVYWIKQQIIDYIIPQVYWNISHPTASYSKLLSWWKNIVSGTNVDLYIGQAAYKAGSNDQASSWYGTSEIVRQLKLNADNGIEGSVFFNYKSLSENPALSAVIKAVYEQRDGKTASIPVTITRPSGNISTSFKSFYLNGASDPSKPLYINGQPIENRSTQGYFGVLVPLKAGANSFTLSQEGSFANCTIFNLIPLSAPSKMSKVEIPASSTFPQTQEYRMPGEKITLSCLAPVGSTVAVKIGNKSYNMTPAKTASGSSGVYAARYSYVYTIPSYSGTPKIIDLGTPVYSMKYKGTSKTQKAPAKIGVIMKGAPFYAEILEPVVDTYIEPVSGNGAANELYKGMVESITGMTGKYARLSSGQWVFKSNVKAYTLKTPKKVTIKKADYIVGEKWDTVKFELSSPTAAIASFDGKKLILKITSADIGAKPFLPDNSLFSAVSAAKTENGTQYELTVKNGVNIEGYYVTKTTSGLELMVKRKVVSTNIDFPLAGINIMIDPGHGGSESGAIGPLGNLFAEKDINLKTSLKLKAELEALGANVLMTRTTDKYISLSNRLDASRNAKPDMFISVHANSMSDNVDISKINGFCIFYREAFAKRLSDDIYNSVINNLKRNKHGVNNRNFYVTRGLWTPSVLIESGFVPNPNEFEWLTDEEEQNKLVRSLTEGILKYFSN